MTTLDTLPLTRTFSCEPYYTGTLEIVSIHHEDTVQTWPSGRPWPRYTVVGRVIEGHSHSRLFGAASSTPLKEGSKIRLYRVTAETLLAGGHLRYVYPCG